MTGYVYFIQAGDGPVKIGYTLDVFKRLGALQTSSPMPLTLLGRIEADASMERQLHDQFSHARMHGEWFSPHPDILALAEANPPVDWKPTRRYMERNGPCTQVAVSLDLVGQLKKLAARNGRSIVSEVSAAITAHLENQASRETDMVRG